MKIRVNKAMLAAAGLAVAVTVAGGVAVGAGADDWYTGDNATVADPDHTDVALKLYNASGVEVTSGNIGQPLAAFAAAGGDVRASDTFATLYVHLPQSDTAPGAWPGIQVTGTDRFSGGGAVAAPGPLSGKPYVRTTAAGYTLAEVAEVLPNDESGESFAGVYELRLRTSSQTAGVSTEYAAAYLKITGSAWAVTTAPILGDGTASPSPSPVAVGTSVAVTWPAKLTYGTAATVGVTVNPASGTAKPTGTVSVVLGSTSLASGTLSGGKASLKLPAAALAPGSRSLKVTYSGAAGAFNPSQSAAKAFAVAKAAPGKPALKVTKKPTPKKAGAANVTVKTKAGLAKAGGKVQLVLKKGKKTVRVNGTVKAGVAKVKLPKLAKGTWAVTITYLGDARYTSSKATAKVASKK